jgi:hypothetical protein
MEKALVVLPCFHAYEKPQIMVLSIEKLWLLL